MKKLLGVMFVLAFFILVTACGDKEEEANKLTVLVEGGSPAEDVADLTKDEFKEETGYEIVIESVPYSGVYDRMRTELTSQAGAFDVATIDTIWLPALYEGLEPIQGEISEEMKDDLFPGLLDGASIDENIYGLPTWTNSKTLIYRTDLFEDEENRDKFNELYGYELKVPENWEQYRDVAQFFTENVDDVYGASVFGSSEGDSVASWLDHVTQAGAEELIINKDNEVIVNDEYHVKALEFLNEIVNEDDSSAEGVLETASAETAELFYNGKLAMMLGWGHFYIPSNDPESSQVAGDVGVAPMIAGEAGIGVVPGPWYQVIPVSSEKKDIAKEYLQFMYEKNELYAESLGVAARQSVFDEYGKKDEYTHLNGLSENLKADQTQNRPFTDKWQQIESEALIPALQNVLSGSMTSQESLDEAKEQIEEIIN